MRVERKQHGAQGVDAVDGAADDAAFHVGVLRRVEQAPVDVTKRAGSGAAIGTVQIAEQDRFGIWHGHFPNEKGARLRVEVLELGNHQATRAAERAIHRR